LDVEFDRGQIAHLIPGEVDVDAVGRDVQIDDGTDRDGRALFLRPLTPPSSSSTWVTQ
jgi:hypothetical protein